MPDDSTPAPQVPPAGPIDPVAPADQAFTSPPAEQPDPLAAAEKRITRLRRWVIALSVVVGLLGISALCGLFALVGSFGMFASGFEADPEEIESAVRDAYGDDLKSVSVREVQMTDEAIPFPYSVLEGPGSVFAVEYRLKSSDVPFSAAVWDVDEMRYRGLFPMTGSVVNRLSEEEFAALLEAWKAEYPNKPIGGIVRYGDPEMMMESASLPPTITVGGVDYATNDLWRIQEGDVIKGDTFEMDDTTWSVVFSRDPKTGKFVFVGREQGMSMF